MLISHYTLRARELEEVDSSQKKPLESWIVRSTCDERFGVQSIYLINNLHSAVQAGERHDAVMSTPQLQPICSIGTTENTEQHSSLRAVVEALRARNSQEFANTLDERKAKEREWANFSRDERLANSCGETNEKYRGNAKWYSTTRLSLEYRDTWLAERVAGRVFLDYACGNGLETLKAARMGAALALGIDVSNISIANATEAAKREGLADRCMFIEGDCESTGLPDGSVDVILCSYMLHHLDLNYAYPEMRRILKPGGCVLACEALNYNPLIKLYRKVTPELRTEWEKEHILSLKDVRVAKRYFNVGKIRYWHLSSVLGAFLRGVPGLFRIAMPVLNAADSVLVRIPGVQLMAWQFSFELFKPFE
jgi:ubiquinone/menaquinone biosynthesis C-methylase UbiE